jgi:hypothetical protein
MKPQRSQRNTLRTLKEYRFKDITEKIISVLLIFIFNVDKLKDGIKRVIL